MKKTIAIIGMLGLMSVNFGSVLAVVDPLAPTITSVTPHTGPPSGGTMITITGTNLASSTVTIGGTPTTDTVVAEDAMSLTTVTASNGLSTEDVVVTTPHGSALLEGGFTFTNATTTDSTSTPSTTHTITYTAGVNGTLSGSTTQIVADGGTGTSVTATGNDWFQFSNWSDGSTANPRTDTNVTGDINVSANFISSSMVQPCNGSTFDTFATGTVNGQGGWHVLGDFDQEIVPNTFGFATYGCKTLRFSDATTSPFIYNQTFSYTGSDEAGETDAVGGDTPVGTRQNHFEAQFDIATVTHNEQPGLHMSVAADRGDGTRMSAISFEDSAGGIQVFFDDVTGTTSPVTFNETQVAWNLNRTVPHTVKLVIDFVDGPSNDVVKVYVDNVLVHTGTSWENFYRYDNDAYPAPNNTSRTVTSLSFSELGTAHPENKWNGFLIDNVTLATTVIPETPGDTTPPVITLNGSSTMDVLLNGTFTDPGASAHDDFDGFMSVTATGTVDTSTLGQYILTYTASDTAHNTASTTRTVNVVATSTSSESTSTPPVTNTGGTGGPNGIPGCMDRTATNYDPTAIYAGTCTYATSGGGSGGGIVLGASTSTVSTGTSSNEGTNPGPTITVTSSPTPNSQPTLVFPNVSVQNFLRDLHLGSKGNDVFALQQILMAAGFMRVDTPTLYFGLKTKAAVKAWQKKKGLPATGYFGKLSRAMIGK